MQLSAEIVLGRRAAVRARAVLTHAVRTVLGLVPMVSVGARVFTRRMAARALGILRGRRRGRDFLGGCNHHGTGCDFRFVRLAPALLFRSAARFFSGARFRLLFLAMAVGLGARLFLGFALELRFAELADRVFALRVDLRLCLFLDNAALDVGALLAHFDVDRFRSRAALTRDNGDLADRTPLQRDLPRR